MRNLRFAELLCAMLSTALCAIGIAVAWIVPQYSGSGKIYRNGHLVYSVTHNVSLAQALGTGHAIGLLALFAVLAALVAVTAIQHWLTHNARWLGGEWAVVALYALAAYAAVGVFFVVFWPSALLALAAAIFASITGKREATLRRAT